MKKYLPVLFVILAAAAMRLVPHPANVTPLCAIALFGAAYLDRKWLAFAAPLMALFMSDLVLNNIVYKSYFTDFQWFTSAWMYLALASVITVGFLNLRQITPLRLGLASVIGSVAFFLLSNVWSWQWDPMYTKDAAGLLTCYVAGLPFLLKAMAGDLFYTTVLFGGWALAQRGYKASGLSLDKA